MQAPAVGQHHQQRPPGEQHSAGLSRLHTARSRNCLDTASSIWRFRNLEIIGGFLQDRISQRAYLQRFLSPTCPWGKAGRQQSLPRCQGRVTGTCGGMRLGWILGFGGDNGRPLGCLHFCVELALPCSKARSNQDNYLNYWDFRCWGILTSSRDVLELWECCELPVSAAVSEVQV